VICTVYRERASAIPSSYFAAILARREVQTDRDTRVVEPSSVVPKIMREK
jgi:hypothetical protein